MEENSQTTKTIRADYLQRINRVIDYIEAHLDENHTLETVSYIACFSKFHFHRIFQSVTGERLSECIQRLRLEKAAALLHGSPLMTVTEIGLRCGFASSASFANAFKRHFGTSASSFRCSKQSISQKRYICLPNEDPDKIDIKIEQQKDSLTYHIKGDNYQRSVEIVDLPPWHVAYIRYTGPYKGDTPLFARLWNKLAAWAAPLGLLNNPDAVFLTLCHDDPEITMEEKLRVSVCIGIDKGIATTGEVGKMQLPGGKYAVCRFTLRSQDYPAAWGWMFGTWLPLSGFQADDRIAFERFIPQDQPQDDEKVTVAICIPVKSATNNDIN
ncbi:MAG TPA: AraC family transcriptional regulator [Chitinispirillaceae bacterium]|nr:AraC family transcriptional regulator [Chitinispirillaceae bacterium]